jgi:hypothetical protein
MQFIPASRNQPTQMKTLVEQGQGRARSALMCLFANDQGFQPFSKQATERGRALGREYLSFAERLRPDTDRDVLLFVSRVLSVAR